MATENETSGVPEDKPSLVIADTPSVENQSAPWFRRPSILAAFALLIAAGIGAFVFSNSRTDHATAGKPSTVEALPAKPPGQNQTIRQYMKDN